MQERATLEGDRSEGDALLKVQHLSQEFRVPADRHAVIHAVSDVTFSVGHGETVGVVGETGCGKTTMARSIMQIVRPTSREVLLNGTDLAKLKGRSLREAQRSIRFIFQDPFSSLNPRMRVSQIVREPLDGFGLGDKKSRKKLAIEMLDLVGLDPLKYGHRRPREMSGGQCQRVAIARALVVSPQLIVCDEVVASLDVLVQAQILDLFDELKKSLGVAYLFISHDLPVVEQISHRVVVMYLGKFCEVAPVESLFSAAFHPYTASLLAANPEPDPRRRRVRSGFCPASSLLLLRRRQMSLSDEVPKRAGHLRRGGAANAGATPAPYSRVPFPSRP